MPYKTIRTIFVAALMATLVVACADRNDPQPESSYQGYWINESAVDGLRRAKTQQDFCQEISNGFETHMADYHAQRSLNAFLIDAEGSVFQLDRNALTSGKPSRFLGKIDNNGRFRAEESRARVNLIAQQTQFSAPWNNEARFTRADRRLFLDNGFSNASGIALRMGESVAYVAVEYRDLDQYSQGIERCIRADQNLRARVLGNEVGDVTPERTAPGQNGVNRGEDYAGKFGRDGSPWSRTQPSQGGAQNRGGYGYWAGRNGYGAMQGPPVPPPRVQQGPPAPPTPVPYGPPPGFDPEQPDLPPGVAPQGAYPRLIEPQAR